MTRSSPQNPRPVCKVCDEDTNELRLDGIPVYFSKTICHCSGPRMKICHRCARDYILCSPRGCYECKKPWRNIELIPGEMTYEQFNAWLGDSGSELVVWVFDLLACAAFIHFMHPYIYDLVYGTTLSALTVFVLGIVFCAIFVYLLKYIGRFVGNGLVIPLLYIVHKILGDKWNFAVDFRIKGLQRVSK